MDTVPPPAADFVQTLYVAMSTNNVGDVRELYFKGWREVTKDFYTEFEWPSAAAVAHLCENDQTFFLFYNELCNRHIFMHGQPGLRHRFESWSNYRKMFDKFLDGSVNFGLPLEWLNDLLDEFLYQWQDFQAFRHAPNKDPAESDVLRTNPNVWKTQTVLSYLQAFCERAVPAALGAFAYVGLCRAHCILADYRQALRCLDTLDIDDQRAAIFQLPSCSVSLLYHLGFAYLMSRRYSDALALFSRVLISHRSTKEGASSFSEEQMTNRYDKVLALATLASALCPGLRVDDPVKKMMYEKFDKLFGKDGAKLDMNMVRAGPAESPTALTPLPPSCVGLGHVLQRLPAARQSERAGLRE
jgi:translation initiation factor 3 subunit L